MLIEEQLKEITSGDRVFASPEVLEHYAQDEGFTPRIRPHCVVKPASMQEIQKIVMLANDTQTPLVPVSSSAPHFNGGTVPSAGGAVVVDLTSMNRVIRVDAKNKVAIIEPGVTFSQFSDALKEHGLAPYTPLAPRNTRSVLTSYLEREAMTIPNDHWETQDPLLCTEIVYGSGDLFRTGSAAGPGTPEDQWEVGRAMIRGYGPTQTDFTKLSMAAQGTMGIVTWASVKCKHAPAVNETLLVTADKLPPLLDLAYKTMWRRIGNQMMIVNHQTMASLFASNENEYERLRDTLPPWILICNFEGIGLRPEDRVAWQTKAFSADAQQFGLKTETRIAGIKGDEVGSVISSPSPEPYWKIRHEGGNQDIFFITTLDQTPKFVDQMKAMVESSRLSAKDIGVYLQPTVQGSNCHCEFNLAYDPDNARVADRIKSLNEDAAAAFSNRGAFFSRPYGAWAQTAYGRDTATVSALRKVKKIFDPKMILNPSKLCF